MQCKGRVREGGGEGGEKKREGGRAQDEDGGGMFETCSNTCSNLSKREGRMDGWYTGVSLSHKHNIFLNQLQGV